METKENVEWTRLKRLVFSADSGEAQTFFLINMNIAKASNYQTVLMFEHI